MTSPSRRGVSIALAESEAEVRACFAVMRHLRGQLADADEFVRRVRAQQAAGYRLAAAHDDGAPVAVAGFRFAENLAWGRFLYVDDLVALPELRSRGHGAALLDWLVAHAREHGAAELHLDSGVQRTDAHRFYRRAGLEDSSLHFRRRL